MECAEKGPIMTCDEETAEFSINPYMTNKSDYTEDELIDFTRDIISAISYRI